MEAFQKSEDYEKLMHDASALVDAGKMKEEVHHADFHYFEPIRQCNWERYPVEVSEFKVKPGFRKQVRKIITQNKSVAEWAHNHGLLFHVFTYNAAEDHVVAYGVYRDLLKWEVGQVEVEKSLAEWGVAEFMVEDWAHQKAKHHDTHIHTHQHNSGTLHTNAWVYSE